MRYYNYMELTTEHRTYLTNKHRGGLSNQKGNTFEVIYATKEIIHLYSLGVDLDNTYVAAQLEDTFVDDFQIIYDAGLKVYHQCKDTKSLSWEKDEKGEPFYDFRWQKKYSSANGESFKLKIVYSNTSCKIHTSPIPSVIEDVTIKELFPAYPNLNAILVDSEDLQSDIKSILFADRNGHTLDKLSAFAEVIRSEWLELAVPNRIVSLSEIKNQTLSKYGAIINFKDLPNVEISDELKMIFDRFPEFSYLVNGKNILWSYKKLSGQFCLSDELNSNIIEANPSEIFQLITLFN